MANTNPTGGGSAIALTVSPNHGGFLRGAIADCLDGVEGDLSLAGDQHPYGGRARREAAAYRPLLTGLDAREIVPDPDVAGAVTDLAKTIDAGNEFERVVTEHAAFHGLLDQIRGA